MLTQIFLILVILAQIAFFGFLLLMILYFSSAIFVWPPSMPTDKRSRKAILNFIKAKRGEDASMKMVDLGSGYGHLVKDMAGAFKNADITGVELLRLPYLYSKFIFHRNKNIKIIRDNLYNHDLSEYDVVVFFLRKDHQVDEKIKNEIKKGALVISNNFPLKEHKASDISQISDIFAKRTIYFYEF